MRLFDTHAHLNMKEFDADREDVVKRASSAGVEFILDVGIDAQSSRKAVHLSRTHPPVYAAAGIHPHEASRAADGDLKSIDSMLRDPKVLALGEIGLDYHYLFSPKGTQQSLFQEQIEIGVHAGKPLIIHVREAMKDALRILRETEHPNFRGVFHCFGGSREDVPLVLEMGFHISFTGVVTFRNFSKIDTVTAVPLNRLLLETDAPYMTPAPLRGQRNEPSMLVHTAKRLAEMYGIPAEELVSQSTANARALFGAA